MKTSSSLACFWVYLVSCGSLRNCLLFSSFHLCSQNYSRYSLIMFYIFTALCTLFSPNIICLWLLSSDLSLRAGLYWLPRAKSLRLFPIRVRWHHVGRLKSAILAIFTLWRSEISQMGTYPHTRESWFNTTLSTSSSASFPLFLSLPSILLHIFLFY